MKTFTILAGLVCSTAALAAPPDFSSCKAPLVLHTFINCLDDSCRVVKEDLGELVANLSVQSRDRASGNAVFKAKDGSEVSSDFDCALTDENGDVNDMQCVMQKPVNDRLGRLSLSFNSAEAPYFVAVFYEFGNAPIGTFTTDEDCQ